MARIDRLLERQRSLYPGRLATRQRRQYDEHIHIAPGFAARKRAERDNADDIRACPQQVFSNMDEYLITGQSPPVDL